MPELVIDNIRAQMDKRSNLRNVTILGGEEHNGSNIRDLIFAKAGITPVSKSGERPWTSCEPALSTFIYEMSDADMKFVSGQSDGQNYMINLVKVPSDDPASFLRLVDGAVVMADCTSGLSPQTETVFRESLKCKTVPGLFFNNLDQLLLERSFNPEETYQNMLRILEGANGIISSYMDPEGQVGDVRLNPALGDVAFGSAKDGWAFTLKQFADALATKFNVEPIKLMTRFWGDNYYNPESNEWKKEMAPGFVRGFNHFILGELHTLFTSVMNCMKDVHHNFVSRHQINLSSDENTLAEKPLLDAITRKWLPLEDTMLQMFVISFPSPIDAQRYKVESYYQGSDSDEAGQSFKNCDASGQLVMYVCSMVPASDKSCSYGLGRVFGGKVATGFKTHILDDGGNRTVKDINQTVLMMDDKVESVLDVPSGNICGIVGLEGSVTKTATITSCESAANIK